MRMRELAAVMAGVTFGMAVMPDMTVLAADNNMDYRRKVVGIAGIMNNTSTGLNDPVTRAEFANMLVKASTYRDYLPATSNVSVYADVPATAQYVSSIRIAAEQNWITGYLGGLYKLISPLRCRRRPVVFWRFSVTPVKISAAVFPVPAWQSFTLWN